MPRGCSPPTDADMSGPLLEAWRRLSVHPLIRPLTEQRIRMQWQFAGSPVPPPPLVKHLIVKDYQRRFGPRVFVETGTFAGDMIEAVADRFDRAYSIELDDRWYANAVERFKDRPSITVLHGDSASRLRDVVAALEQPALFWLDAHYSGPLTARGVLDSPIVQELEIIRAHPVRGHVVLIDDMRVFTGEGGYPTVPELVEWIRTADPGSTIEVRDDILRWHA